MFVTDTGKSKKSIIPFKKFTSGMFLYVAKVRLFYYDLTKIIETIAATLFVFSTLGVLNASDSENKVVYERLEQSIEF
jgi:hypothetical protein